MYRKAINGDYNCVLKIRAKHPSYSEYITTDYCFYVVRRGQKGEARSYTPYLMGVYNENTNYVWDDSRRDFVYYPEVTAEGKEIYYIWGVKEYGMNFIGIAPGKKSSSGASEYWEKGDVYTLLVTNCIFADNAVLGGMKFTDQKMTSSDDGENIVIDGNSGEFTANKATIRGTIYAKSGSFTVEVNANCVTFFFFFFYYFFNSLFMKYAANQHNNYVINCGLVNLIDMQTDKVNPTFYLPSVSSGEFM